MKSKKDLIIQLYARSAAPARDYYGLTITLGSVILNIWNITHGPHVYPKRYDVSLDDFIWDKKIQSEIFRTFGSHVLTYVKQLALHEINLQCMPQKIFLFVMRYLAASDIIRLSQTSKIFFDLCNTNDVWRIIYTKIIKPNEQLINSEEIDWKALLKRKLCKKLKESIRQTKTSVNITAKDEKKSKLTEKKTSESLKCIVKDINGLENHKKDEKNYEKIRRNYNKGNGNNVKTDGNIDQNKNKITEVKKMKNLDLQYNKSEIVNTVNQSNAKYFGGDTKNNLYRKDGIKSEIKLKESKDEITKVFKPKSIMTIKPTSVIKTNLIQDDLKKNQKHFGDVKKLDGIKTNSNKILSSASEKLVFNSLKKTLDVPVNSKIYVAPKRVVGKK